MEKGEFLRILKKYREGTASAEEIAFLHAYYKLLEAGAESMGMLSGTEKEKIKNEIRQSLTSRISRESQNSQTGNILSENGSIQPRTGSIHLRARDSRTGNLRRVAAAAAVLLTLSAGLYFYSRKDSPGEPGKRIAAEEVTVPENDIAPGGSKAILTLSNGKKVMLGALETGALIRQGTATVRKKEQGQLVYDADRQFYEADGQSPGTGNYSSGAGTQQSSGSSPAYNTVSTPRGGQYMVRLPDGTRVWLNAASSLTFPVAFNGKERRITLKGEAYFEVAKDTARPFKVTAGGTEIAVLGTHFNVMAYEDEPRIETTLLEGAVKITKNTGSKVLSPGEQASVGKNGRIRVTTVNTEEAVAWKNGYFLFDNEPLESIMRKISRWYDAEIIYRGNPDGLYFGGMVSRTKNISEILKIMELTENIRFEIDPGDSGGKGRRITVML